MPVAGRAAPEDRCRCSYSRYDGSNSPSSAAVVAKDPLAQTLRARVTQATTVTEILGFDPLAVLGAALRREDGEGEPSE